MRFRSLVLCAALVSTGAPRAFANHRAACACAVPTVESSYGRASDVAFVDLQRTYVTGDTRFYVARVVRTFKGCLRAQQHVVLKTPVLADECGAELPLRRYLIHGDAAGHVLGTPALAISLCNYDRQVSVLPASDLEFLEARMVCCEGQCSCADGSQPVQCFADPCATAPACPGSQCVANHCGGCHAEQYDALGHAACEDLSECRGDPDCKAGSWCRRAQSKEREPVYECAPFVGEGSRCQGTTLPWLVERCAPGLTCDTPDTVPGATGVCRRPCEAEGECDAHSYCRSDQLCDDDGACERDIDCNLEGNTYGYIDQCAGHGICENQRCAWMCGEPQCLDLAGLDLGRCAAILGWAMVEGRCTQLSGCGARDFELFATRDACQRTCER